MQAEAQKETEEKARVDLDRKRSAERHLAEARPLSSSVWFGFMKLPAGFGASVLSLLAAAFSTCLEKYQ